VEDSNDLCPSYSTGSRKSLYFGLAAAGVLVFAAGLAVISGLAVVWVLEVGSGVASFQGAKSPIIQMECTQFIFVSLFRQNAMLPLQLLAWFEWLKIFMLL